MMKYLKGKEVLDLRDEFNNKLKRAGLTRPAKDSDRKKDRHNRVV